ncbi:MAG: restriction endonuclease subunit S [Pseudonocardiaceae bacterium]
MRGLPRGWEWTRFEEVATVESNLVDPAEYPNAPHIAPNHIERRTGRLLPYTTVRGDAVTSSKHRFFPGQILYSKIRPYLAKAVRVEFSGLCSADMYPISTHLDTRFFHYWLLSSEFTAFAASQQGRSVLPKINREALAKLPVPVAPSGEQERIVDAIEEHVSRLEAAKALLVAAEERLKVLAHASSRLLFESRSWPWTTLGEIADVAGGVTKDSKRQADPSFVEVPYLRVANVQRGRLDLGHVTTIRVHPDKAKALRLEPGDILLNEGGDRDKLGRGWVWEGQIDGCIHQNHVFRARLHDDFDPYFVSTHANSWGRAWFERHGRQTTNLASISLHTLKQLPVPAPPRAEQESVVDELRRSGDAHLRLNRSIERAREHADVLRRSILVAAFSGRLVPQASDDDPASVLLERIRAQREAAIMNRRTRVHAKPTRKGNGHDR